MAELGVQPPTGLYPQPPAPPSQGALSDPTRMIELFGAITRNQMLQNELKGRAAVGQAVQGALGPSGFDLGTFTNSLKNNPDAAWLAPEALKQGQDNARAQFERMMAIQQQVRQLGGSLSDNPSKEELYNAFTTAVRGGVPPAEAVEMLSAVSGARNKAAVITQFRNMGLTPAEQSQRLPGTPGPGGAAQTEPIVNLNRAGTVATSLPAYAGASIDAMQKDQQIQSGYAQDVEPWRQALDKIEDLKKKYGAGFLGPGTKGRQEMESWLFSISPKLARTLGVDEGKLADYASIEKYLQSGTMSRATNYGAHSDQQLASAAAATPNAKVTDLAVPELIKVQYALRRAEYAQHQQAVARGGVAGEEYLNEKSNWASRNDPRAFMVDLMSPEDRQKLIGSIPKGSPEWQRFNNSLRAGYESGVLNRPGRTPAAPAAAPAAASPPAPAKPAAKTGKQSQAQPLAPAAPAKSDRATYPRYEYRKPGDMGEESRAEPPVPGARLAADGYWYVRQPHANGDYQRVVMNA